MGAPAAGGFGAPAISRDSKSSRGGTHFVGVQDSGLQRSLLSTEVVPVAMIGRGLLIASNLHRMGGHAVTWHGMMS